MLYAVLKKISVRDEMGENAGVKLFFRKLYLSHFFPRKIKKIWPAVPFPPSFFADPPSLFAFLFRFPPSSALINMNLAATTTRLFPEKNTRK